MPKYTALASGTKAVKTKDEAGDTVTHYVRYNKGDEVEMSEADAQRLLDTGGLAPAGEASDAPTQVAFDTVPTPQHPHGSAGVAPGATSGQTADEGLRGDAEAEGDSVAPDDVDAFEDMTVPALRVAAAERGLDATGNKAELQERLRAYTSGE